MIFRFVSDSKLYIYRRQQVSDVLAPVLSDDDKQLFSSFRTEAFSSSAPDMYEGVKSVRDNF